MPATKTEPGKDWTKVIDPGDGTSILAVTLPPMTYRNIAGAATTVVKSGTGVLGRIIINKPIANGVITVYDNTAGSGAKIATITNPAVLLNQQGNLEYFCKFSTGLTIITSAADDITVLYL